MSDHSPLTECPNCGRPLTSYSRYTQDGSVLLTIACDDCGVVGPVRSAPRMPERTANPIFRMVDVSGAPSVAPPFPICPKCDGFMNRVRYVLDCGRLRAVYHCPLDDEIETPAADVRGLQVPFDDPDNHDYSEAAA